MHPTMGNASRAVGSLVVGAFFSFAVGCASPQADGLSSCEQDKAALLATIRAQRDEVNSLRDRTASLESRLADSETEIARLDPTRQAHRGAIAGSAAGDATESGGLGWRSPAAVATDKDQNATRR